MASAHTDVTSDDNEENYDKDTGDLTRKAVRRLKNRESARRVRARRVQEVHELQAQINSLATENAGLRTCLAQMQGHMQAMVERVHELTTKYEAVTMDNIRLKRYLPPGVAEPSSLSVLARQQEQSMGLATPSMPASEPLSLPGLPASHPTASAFAGSWPPPPETSGGARGTGPATSSAFGAAGSVSLGAGMAPGPAGGAAMGGLVMSCGAHPVAGGGLPPLEPQMTFKSVDFVSGLSPAGRPGDFGAAAASQAGMQPELTRLLDHVSQQRLRRKERGVPTCPSAPESSSRSISDHISADFFTAPAQNRCLNQRAGGASNLLGAPGSGSIGAEFIPGYLTAPGNEAVAASAQQQQQYGTLQQYGDQYGSGNLRSMLSSAPHRSGSLSMPPQQQQQQDQGDACLGVSMAGQDAPVGGALRQQDVSGSQPSAPVPSATWAPRPGPSRDWSHQGGVPMLNNTSLQQAGQSGDSLSLAGGMGDAPGAPRPLTEAALATPLGLEPAAFSMMLRQHQQQQNLQLDLLQQAAQWQQHQQTTGATGQLATAQYGVQYSGQHCGAGGAGTGATNGGSSAGGAQHHPENAPAGYMSWDMMDGMKVDAPSYSQQHAQMHGLLLRRHSMGHAFCPVVPGTAAAMDQVQLGSVPRASPSIASAQQHAQAEQGAEQGAASNAAPVFGTPGLSDGAMHSERANNGGRDAMNQRPGSGLGVKMEDVYRSA